MIDELKVSLRSLAANYRFSAAFLATFCVTAAFVAGASSFFYGVLLRPLPYTSPEQIVSVWREAAIPGLGLRRTFVSAPQFSIWKKQQHLFSNAAAFYVRRQPIGKGEHSREVLTAEVTHEFFDVLGIEPVLGRGFRAVEDRGKAPRVAVLSSQIWQTLFNKDPNVLGKVIQIDRKDCTIVGVMPDNFRFYVRERPDQNSPPIASDVWVSIGERLDQLRPYPNWYHLRMIGRLAEGASIPVATTWLLHAT